MKLVFDPIIRRAFTARRWLNLLGYHGDYVFFEKNGAIDPLHGGVHLGLLVTLRLTKDPKALPEFVFFVGPWRDDLVAKLHKAQGEWNDSSQEEREALVESCTEMDKVSFIIAVKAKGLDGTLPS